MNEIASGFPILTLITVLPLVGAAIALFVGKHARGVALVTTLRCLGLSLLIWTSLPADGSIGLVEMHPWAPSLGIEYHLGVDGLGALMLLLSAIVTLMSVDASHRVHHMPGLFFGLVLIARIGPLRLLHRAQFLPLVLVLGAEPHPRLLPHQIVGRPAPRPGGHAVLRLHHGRLGGAAALVSRHLSLHGTMDFGDLTAMAASGALTQMVTAHLGAVMPWLAIGVLAGFAVKVPIMPFHTWLPAAYAEAPSPVTMLLTGAMSKMGVYGLLRIALPIFGLQIAPCARRCWFSPSSPLSWARGPRPRKKI